MGYRLVELCGACPESYDAFDGDRRIGYLRLRHGRFTVECPDSGGVLVVDESPEGDGIFTTEERAGYLAQAEASIKSFWRKRDREREEAEPRESVPSAGYRF